VKPLADREQIVHVNGRNLKLSNLEKVLWPSEKITKAEVIKYYAELGQYIIAFTKDRPIMARRYPHGITRKYFVQKHFAIVPTWVKRFSFKSSDYILCNELPTLIWLGNLAALEINHMLARSPTVSKHDLVLIDLDPHPPATFDHARIAARGVATVLERLGLEFLLKTSGADGIHFFIPIKPRYSVEKIRRFVYAIGRLVETANPKLATVSTKADRKTGHVYVDFLQNGLEKTITAPLSIRALPGAPVSYPLTVKQLEDHRLSPGNFTVRKAPRKSPALRGILRLSELSQDLDTAFAKLGIKI
jgi:bifunctional non-homologous end joining protein LigD